MCLSKSEGGIGFRDIHAFNWALLAKQAWRLVQCPDSLPARIFKAKYFPHVSFWDAQLGSRPSFVWRGIWEARCVLEYGVRWRIGSGESVLIWRDKWVPGLDSFKISSLRRDLDEDATVAQLMSPVQGMWNEELIRRIFSPDEAEAILNIVLGSRANNDRLIWHYSTDGVYSVRSGYRVLREIAVRRNDDIFSFSNQVKSASKIIWKLRVPSKVHHFLWRVVSDSLPTRSNLIRRINLPSTFCPVCDAAEEDSMHILLNCPVAVQALSACAFNLSFSSTSWTGVDLVLRFLNRLDTDQQALLAMCLWKIWNNRNSIVFDGKARDPLYIAKSAKLLLSRYRDANLPTQVPSSISVRWYPPLQNWIKLNFDAAVPFDRPGVGIGLIARNENGEFVAARSKILSSSTDPASAEALAAYHAAIFALDCGFRAVCFEGDSSVVINAINGAGGGSGPYGHIISDIERLSNVFRSCIWSFVRREGNGVAHMLAKQAVLLSLSETWMEEAPLLLLPPLRFDLC